jgi:hypothetical protein
VRRLIRYSINALTIFSSLLCVAAVILWARPQTSTDEVTLAWGRTQLLILAGANRVVLMFPYVGRPTRTIWEHKNLDGISTNDIEDFWHDVTTPRTRHGLDVSWPDRKHPAMMAPPWLVTLLFGLAPLTWLWRWWRRHPRNIVGRCRFCQYDLTGNVSGICPECGTKIE